MRKAILPIYSPWFRSLHCQNSIWPSPTLSSKPSKPCSRRACANSGSFVSSNQSFPRSPGAPALRQPGGRPWPTWPYAARSYRTRPTFARRRLPLRQLDLYASAHCGFRNWRPRYGFISRTQHWRHWASFPRLAMKFVVSVFSFSVISLREKPRLGWIHRTEGS